MISAKLNRILLQFFIFTYWKSVHLITYQLEMCENSGKFFLGGLAPPPRAASQANPKALQSHE